MANNKRDLLLKCALCRVDLVNNQPKSLPCLHTFCTHCLTNKEQQFIQDDNIVCPVCHTSVSRSSKDSEITKNLELDVIMEKLLRVRHLQQSKKRHCGMCSDESLSTHWCRDCEMFLCDVCLVHHGRYKPSDKVIDLSQGVDADKVSDFILTTKCSRHEKNFKMYCAQCEICLCSTCSLEHRSDTNVNCVPVSIGKVAPDTKSQGLHLLGETCSHLEKGNQQIEGMKLKIEDLKRQCSGKGAEIWEHMEETVRRLKENARVLIAELEAATKSEIEELEKLIQLRQDHVKEVEILDNNFHELLQSFDNVDILLNYSRLKSKCEKLLVIQPNNSTSQQVNIEYNSWYLKTREMSKTKPLGRCLKYFELTEDSSPLDKSLNTKQASDIFLPPMPSVCYPGLIICHTFFSELNPIFVTDQKHVLVSVYSTLYEYNNINELCETYELKDIQECSDLCQFSSDKICIVGGNLNLMQMNENKPFLRFSKLIKPNVKYYSICNCFGKILVCDFYCCVYLLNEKGTVHRTVLDIKKTGSPFHKIRRGPFEDTFLLLDYEYRKVFCYSLDGSECLFSFNVGKVRDLCTDKYGNICIDEKYCASGRTTLYVFSHVTKEKHYFYNREPNHGQRIFIKDDVLYVASDIQVEKFHLYYHEIDQV